MKKSHPQIKWRIGGIKSPPFKNTTSTIIFLFSFFNHFKKYNKTMGAPVLEALCEINIIFFITIKSVFCFNKYIQRVGELQ